MSKKIKTIGAWLGEVFGTSHKAISENLSAEQYSQFVAEAEKLADGQVDDEKIENAETIAAANLKNTELEGQIQSLQVKLGEVELALETEKKTNEETAAKLVESETKLTASAQQNQKLRDAVNPLSDEDLTNSEGSEKGLTKADIEARGIFNKNNPKA